MNSATQPVTDTRRFLWHNWLMIEEVDGSNVILRKYVWALDLAGQNGRQNSILDAGGIGGLLSVYDTNGGTSTTSDDKQYAYQYDANGNVGQVLESTATTASFGARYEYDAYGNITVSLGSYASANPVRWSTKLRDVEHGADYYGHRYLLLGRWLNRDALEERGSVRFTVRCATI